MIILGTSLKVQPFASLVTAADRVTPRLLINRELVGTPDDIVHLLGLRDPRAINANLPANTRDVFCAGDCDEQVASLASLLGWRAELDARHEAYRESSSSP